MRFWHNYAKFEVKAREVKQKQASGDGFWSEEVEIKLSRTPC